MNQVNSRNDFGHDDSTISIVVVIIIIIIIIISCHTAFSSKPATRRCCGRMMGQTDRRTDGRTLGRFIDPGSHTMGALGSTNNHMGTVCIRMLHNREPFSITFRGRFDW